jgi:hypothetical protein
LGIEPDLYGGRVNAFKLFKNMLNENGVIVFSEPVWTKKPVAPEILKSLCCKNESFLTRDEVDQLMKTLELEQLGSFVSSKEDWELYVRSPKIVIKEIMEKKNELAAEARVFLEAFKTEYEAAGKHWDNVLWVVKPK